MHGLQLLACATLALLVTGAPTSSSVRETQQQLEHLLLDLEQLQKEVENYKNLRDPGVLTFKFYLPTKVTELKHLQCLAEELKSLEQVLKLDKSKNSDVEDLMSNINVTVLGLKGPETNFICHYEDEPVCLMDFLIRWITSCKGIFSTFA